MRPLMPARTETIFCEFTGIVNGWVSVICSDVVAVSIVGSGSGLWIAFT